MVPRGRGTSAKMKMRKGLISGMLLVNVYAIDFFRLSKIKRPEMVVTVKKRLMMMVMMMTMMMMMMTMMKTMMMTKVMIMWVF